MLDFCSGTQLKDFQFSLILRGLLRSCDARSVASIPCCLSPTTTAWAFWGWQPIRCGSGGLCTLAFRNTNSPQPWLVSCNLLLFRWFFLCLEGVFSHTCHSLYSEKGSRESRHCTSLFLCVASSSLVHCLIHPRCFGLPKHWLLLNSLRQLSSVCASTPSAAVCKPPRGGELRQSQASSHWRPFSQGSQHHTALFGFPMSKHHPGFVSFPSLFWTGEQLPQHLKQNKKFPSLLQMLCLILKPLFITLFPSALQISKPRYVRHTMLSERNRLGISHED